MAADDERDIVVAAAVARAGGFERVNIVDRYGAATPDGLLTVGPANPVISDAVRASIERALAPASVTWVGSIAEVIGTAPYLPSYEQVGAVLTLGSPVIDGDHATIAASMGCGPTCGFTGTYTLALTATGRVRSPYPVHTRVQSVDTLEALSAEKSSHREG